MMPVVYTYIVTSNVTGALYIYICIQWCMYFKVYSFPSVHVLCPPRLTRNSICPIYKSLCSPHSITW